MRFSLRHQQEVKWLWSIPKCIHSKRVLLSATSFFSTILCDFHSDETAIEGNQADSAWMHLTSFDQPWHPLLNKCKSAIYNLLLPSCTQLLLLRDPSRKTSRGFNKHFLLKTPLKEGGYFRAIGCISLLCTSLLPSCPLTRPTKNCKNWAAFQSIAPPAAALSTDLSFQQLSLSPSKCTALPQKYIISHPSHACSLTRPPIQNDL